MTKRFHLNKASSSDPKRYEILQPYQVVDEFFKEGDITVDLGTGNGFFTIPIA